MSDPVVDTSSENNADADTVKGFDEQLGSMSDQLKGIVVPDAGSEGTEKVVSKEEKKPAAKTGEIELLPEKDKLSDRKKEVVISEEDKKKAEAEELAKTQDSSIPDELPAGEQERRDGWRNVKQKNSDLTVSNTALNTTIAERDARIEELEKAAGESSAASPEFQAIVKERDEYRETLKKVSFRDSPDFVESFQIPMENNATEIDNILKQNGIEGINAVQLLSKSGPDLEAKIGEIMPELGVLSKDALVKAVISYKTLEGGRGAALDNAEEYQKNVTAQNQFNSEKAFAEVGELVKASGDFDQLEPDNADDPADVESARLYNEGMSEIQQIAKDIVSKPMSDQEIAVIAYEAAQNRVAHKTLEQRYMHENNVITTQYNDLAKKYNALLGKNPNIGAGDSTDLGGKGDPKPSGDAKLDFENKMSALKDQM